ncbi:hypothetical protein ACIGN6_31770 [Streptomyces sp. NPDC053792]|uniref:hypothetical protein n=1 Tax=Streptomyces sp. NPDC053792 TaxID=3365716 RepID=UPI0037D85314
MPLKKPELPPGPMTKLNNELHALHRMAGEPSLPRMSELWEEGKGKGIYATSRSKSGVAAMFSRPDLPNGEALMDLVALLMTEFTDADKAAVKARQQHFRQLRDAAAGHRDAPPANGLVADLQLRAARYTKLIDAVQYAERTAVSSYVPQRRRDAFEFAAKLAITFLDADDPVVQRLMERADQVSAPDWKP